MTGSRLAVSMGDDFLPLRRHGYHVFHFMSRKSEKKTGPGKAPLGRSSALARPAEAGSPPAGWPGRWTVPGVCILLAAMVWVVFGQTLGLWLRQLRRQLLCLS